mmetsp:Transcript_22827/g.32187  ORF Transcript_22827/g.32187 Transcript_22827/m.32187 type:complete len:212 (-) Transcript_22827:684-1319(-)
MQSSHICQIRISHLISPTIRQCQITKIRNFTGGRYESPTGVKHPQKIIDLENETRRNDKDEDHETGLFDGGLRRGEFRIPKFLESLFPHWQLTDAIDLHSLFFGQFVLGIVQQVVSELGQVEGGLGGGQVFAGLGTLRGLFDGLGRCDGLFDVEICCAGSDLGAHFFHAVFFGIKAFLFLIKHVTSSLHSCFIFLILQSLHSIIKLHGILF